MSKQKVRDTGPEIALRKCLYSIGLRYRLQYRPVPTVRRTADIAFIGAKLAVVVHGCFWHSCPVHATFPSSNAEWWKAKLDRNAARDADTRALWECAGWKVAVVWEHDNPMHAARMIGRLLERGTE